MPDVMHRYLALGDSFTAGTGVGADRSFPAELALRWRERGVDVALTNAAVNGFTTDALIESELPLARDLRPTVVTLAIGANDLVRGGDEARYRAQLARIFAALRDAGAPPAATYALPQPDWSSAPAARPFGPPDGLRSAIEVFNAALRDEALRAAARYLDLYPLMRAQADAGMLAPDGLHPSAEALAQWAAELVARIDISRAR